MWALERETRVKHKDKGQTQVQAAINELRIDALKLIITQCSSAVINEIGVNK